MKALNFQVDSVVEINEFEHFADSDTTFQRILTDILGNTNIVTVVSKLMLHGCMANSRAVMSEPFVAAQRYEMLDFNFLQIQGAFLT